MEVVDIDVAVSLYAVPAVKAGPVASPLAELELKLFAEPLKVFPIQAVLTPGRAAAVFCAIPYYILFDHRAYRDFAVIVKDKPLHTEFSDTDAEQYVLAAVPHKSRLLSRLHCADIDPYLFRFCGEPLG